MDVDDFLERAEDECLTVLYCIFVVHREAEAEGEEVEEPEEEVIQRDSIYVNVCVACSLVLWKTHRFGSLLRDSSTES